MTVLFDAGSNGHAGNPPTGTPTVASLTFAHTCSGSDRGLSVGISVGVEAGNIVARTVTVTYGGVSMLDARTGVPIGVPLIATSTTAGVIHFYLLNPPAGANNVVVTVDSAVQYIVGVSVSATGVGGIAHVNTATSAGATNSPTLAITSAAGNLAVGVGSHGDTITGASGTTTQRAIDNFTNHTSGSMMIAGTADGAATSNINFTSAISDSWVMIGFEFTAGTSPAVEVQPGGSSGNAVSSATMAFPCGISFAVGDVIVVAISLDNNGTNGATSLTSVTDAGGNAYTLRQATFDPGAASAGQTVALAWARIATALLSTDNVTVNMSPNTTSKAAVVWKLRPDSGTVIQEVTFAFTAGSNTATPTVTTSTIGVGDIVVAAIGAESNGVVTADADTTNGSWTAQQTATGNSGTLATSARVASQAKIVTATATQTYNPTLALSDNILGWITFTPAFIRPNIQVQPSNAVHQSFNW